MTKTLPALLTAMLMLAGPVFLAGCSGEKPDHVSGETNLKKVQSSLKAAERTSDPVTRIHHLRNACEAADRLNAETPRSEEAAAFMELHQQELSLIPEEVLGLAMTTRDLVAFQWALARSSRENLDYAKLVAIWKMGKQYRDGCMALYPDQALPVFMDEAIRNFGIRFFDQYIAAFKATGYRVELPLLQNEFNARFTLFIARQIEAALEEGDVDRIRYLLNYMPARVPDMYYDPKTEEVMRAVIDYVCLELKDEQLACSLIELGYAMNRLDVDELSLDDAFTRALAAQPEHAITNILKLNEWHGPLSPKEAGFLYSLPDPPLHLVHQLHLNEAIVVAIKGKDTEEALRFIRLREEVGPMTLYDYDRLLGLSLVYENPAVRNYVTPKCRQVNIYRLDLVELADNMPLFRLYTPKILRKVYRTTDTIPKPDGTTVGRIDELFRSHHPEAVLYVVKNYDLDRAWEDSVKEGRTMLMAVCEGGNLEAARYLIEKKGAKVDAATKFFESQNTLFGQSYSEEGRLTPLFFAAMSGNGDLIKYLASKKADINALSGFGATPLIYAVKQNRLESAKALIALGADVNVVMRSDLRIRDISEAGFIPGDTAYHLAVVNRNAEMQTLLLNAGAIRR